MNFKDYYGKEFKEAKQEARTIDMKKAYSLLREYKNERVYVDEPDQHNICIIPIGYCPYAIWKDNLKPNTWYIA